MVFSTSWDSATPPGSQNASLGDDRIRELKVQIDQRLLSGSGGAGDALLDITNSRTINTDPVEVAPDKIDTVTLDKGAGGWNAVARAVSYFQIASLTSDYDHASPLNGDEWAATGLSITIPGTVLMSSGLEHASGTALGSTDFAILIEADLHAQVSGISSNAFMFFRIRNTTDDVVIGPGDTAALGSAGSDGVRTFAQSDGFSSSSSYQHLSWSGFDNGRTAATTYALEACGSSPIFSGTFAGIRASSDRPATLKVSVFKR